MRRAFVAMLLAAIVSGTAQAQTAVEGRVDRLEGEMRAVQRKVFPGGAAPYVQPDNTPAPAQDLSPGTPATSPVADLSARVDSLEGQLRTLTGAVETDQHRLQLLEARIKTLEDRAAAVPAPDPAATPGATPARPVTDMPPTSATTTPRAPVDRPVDRPIDRPVDRPAAATPARADPTRAAKVAAIERPVTGDAGEDAYLYGYRLWTAKLYPEAEAQLSAVTTKYPTHKRASYAQNLLGRTYLEDNKPSLASLAFLDNYKKWPDGDRAPESLVYLARALVTLHKPTSQVCLVYTELKRSYAAKVDADPKLKAAVVKGRAESNCE